MKIHAPFSDEQVRGLREWQNCEWVHPFTCCEHVAMVVGKAGFMCPVCGYLQEWAHDFMAEGAPPNPLERHRVV